MTESAYAINPHIDLADAHVKGDDHEFLIGPNSDWAGLGCGGRVRKRFQY
jgi:hypothetical protein